MVFDELTEIAVFQDDRVIVGNNARGFYSSYYKLIKPIVYGRVEDYDAFETYVEGF